MQGERCFYCLASLIDGYQVDHMTPLARGGSNAADNIVCACPDCNRRKGQKTAAEFILKEAA
jgi:5-methylcytosine-specific restriction endonuclease McrA